MCKNRSISTTRNFDHWKKNTILNQYIPRCAQNLKTDRKIMSKKRTKIMSYNVYIWQLFKELKTKKSPQSQNKIILKMYYNMGCFVINKLYVPILISRG